MRISQCRRRAAVGTWTVAAGAVLLAAPAAWGAISVDSRSSLVDAFASAAGALGGDPVTDGDTRTGSGTGSFSQRVDALAEAFGALAESEAGQTSSLTFTGGDLSGVNVSLDSFASVSGSSEDDNADATSEFSVLFTIPAGQSYNYTFGGELTSNGAAAIANLYDVTRDSDLLFVNSSNPGTFSKSGQLQPGQYEVFGRTFAAAQSFGGGDSGVTMSLALAPVPEPAAAVALSSLLMVPLIRPRRRH